MKEYIIDATSYQVPEKAINDIMEAGIVEGYGVNVKLSRGCYRNPPMKSKMIVRYKNGTFEGKIRSVFTYDLSYEVTIIFDKFHKCENTNFYPELIPTMQIIE